MIEKQLIHNSNKNIGILQIIDNTLNKNAHELHIFCEFLLLIYFLLIHFHYIFAIEGLMGTIVVGSFNFIGIIFFILMTLKHKNIKIFLLTVLLFGIGIVSILFNHNYNLIYYLTLVRYIGIVIYILYEPRNKLIMTFLIYLTLLLFLPAFTEPLGYSIFTRVSRNHHSIILLVVNFVYATTFFQRKEPVPVVPTMVATFIVVFAGGRGGIISYQVFLIGILIYNLQISKKKNESFFSCFMRYLKPTLCSIFAFLILLTIFGVKKQKVNTYLKDPNNEFKKAYSNIVESEEDLDPIELEHNEKYGFSQKGFASRGRIKLIQLYISYVFSDFAFFLFGVPLTTNDYFKRFLFNLHNSYLKLHAGFGIAGFIIMLFLGLLSLRKIIKNKEWGLGIILLSACIRAFIDIAAFPGPLDIIILYYFLYPFIGQDNRLGSRVSLDRNINQIA